MTRLPCLFQTPRGIWLRARFERRAARVVPSSSAICASGTLSPVIPSLSCSAADIGCSAPRWAAEGGLRFGDLVPAALAMGFVVDVDTTVLPMANAAELADPRVTKIAVLHRFEPGPAMAEWFADHGPGRHHDEIPELRVLGVQSVVDVVQPHSHTPAQWLALVAFAKRFSDEFSDLFEHRNTSPAAHR